MKTTHLKFTKPLVQILILTFILHGSISIFGQEMKPPAPKEPSSNLQLPEPVVFQEIKGSASLPEELILGFALDLGGVILPGNWDVQGKVVSSDNRVITFSTEQGQTGHLVYRLPKGFQLLLADDDVVKLKRNMNGYQTSLGNKFTLLSSDSLEIASGVLPGEFPHKVMIQDGLTLQQEKEVGSLLSESKFELTYMVPVYALTEDGKIKLTLFEPEVIKLDNTRYRIMILQSSKIVSQDKFEETSEGNGYILEYVVAVEK